MGKHFYRAAGIGAFSAMVSARLSYGFRQSSAASTSHNDSESTSPLIKPRADVVFAASAGPSRNRATTGKCRDGLPSFTREEVAAHSSCKKAGESVWVTYKCGVYDVTSFIKQHPGGVKRIMLAAGSDIERYWKQFTIHDEDAVRDILESHRIGNVAQYTQAAGSTAAADAAAEEAVWRNEPQRSAALVPLSKRPFNAETPEGALDEFLTPNDLFFVRSHMPVPLFDPSVADDRHSKFCLNIEGEGIISRCFRISELKEMFAQHTVTTTIQCGGNRRSEMSQVYAGEHAGGVSAVKGLAWSNGAIGTASWKGVYLRDVLHACMAPAADHAQAHVLLEGADSDAAGNFNVSVPFDLAMDARNDCLIAWEMNGEPIPRDHGFPLRAIVPGTVGVRNCKWLQRVSVQSHESQSVWQQQDYKNFPNFLTRPDPSLPSVYSMPVQSAITDVSYDANADAVTVKGYAYAGGGTGVQRVEVSFDGGRTFETTAKILPPPPEVKAKHTPVTRRDSWSWRQTELTLSVEDIRAKAAETKGDPAGRGYSVCLRAITDDNAIQPPVAPYNFRGLLYNGYSCRDVSVE